MSSSEVAFSVSGAVALFNQILETATPTISVVGEVANFKINQGKWVFFDIKDDESSLGCFMSLFNLHTAIEDGMLVTVVARPNVTKWGKFSLTIQTIRPVGEGSIKRAFELLHAKLDKEGLFAAERKRSLPELPSRIGIISSTDAAGYKDFIKILGKRFGGVEITVAPVQVQGEVAVGQVIAALKYFNELAEPPEVVAILRGGGSRDDLAVFDDELLVRAVAASRVPTIAGIGHEIDTTLVDLAADVRASTPSNAAEILVPDKREIIARVDFLLQNLLNTTEERLARVEDGVRQDLQKTLTQTENIWAQNEQKLKLLSATLTTLNPHEILRRGYAIVRDKSGNILRGSAKTGDGLTIENLQAVIMATVTSCNDRSK